MTKKEMNKKYVLHQELQPTGSLTIDYEKELNPSQYEVVTQAGGACLVLAGAGSGKTRTLIYRVAYLLEKGTPSEDILLVTFTNKAAQEMKNRVELLLGAKAKGLWCGTFHHIANRTLRIYSKQAGLPDNFSILDDEDSRDLVKNCIKSLKFQTGDAKFPKPNLIQNILSFSSNARKSVAAVTEKYYPHLALFTREFEKIKTMYDDKKKRAGLLDYDDLLMQWIGLLKNSDAVRERLTRQFRYIMVDEYQDTNRLQYELIQLLASHHKNVLVVGDDAQSIYSFRAAEIKNILDFPENYAGTKIFKLETNYRSTKPILDLANQSIRNNRHQFPKKLKSVREGGALPQLVRVRDNRQEARFIVQRILDFRESGIPLSDVAVLFRAHYLSAELEMELVKCNIPYIVRGGIRFFEQQHVKDVLAFLKILVNPMDEIGWTRALTLQPGIGPGYAQRIFSMVEAAGGDLSKVISADFGLALPPKPREGLFNFKKLLKGLYKEERQAHPDMLIEEILEKGYNKHVLMNFENAQERLEDLRELVNFAHTYKKLKDFLADATLKEGFKGESIIDAGLAGESPDNLVLSTIHQAKGLEWHAVVVIGLSEGQFPHAKSMRSQSELEEERRLFYVAVTRAKEELLLTHPMMRFDYSQGMIISRPSVFIEELPASAYDEVDVEEENANEETIYLDEK